MRCCGSCPGRHDADVSTEERALPAVQRAYFYVVMLVAIHMIVLGVANLLRVGAEIALGAPSGGFTGLPFVFAEFNRPREQYREQASLAIALLLVAVPAWYLHYRAADAAARRSLVAVVDDWTAERLTVRRWRFERIPRCREYLDAQ